MKKLGSDLMKVVVLTMVILGTAQLGAVGSGAALRDAVLFSSGCYAVALIAFGLYVQLERAIARERRKAVRRAAARRLAGQYPCGLKPHGFCRIFLRVRLDKDKNS